MKASDLMLGNIVAPAYDQKPDSIIALEDGSVHLKNNESADDERDIEGVPLTDWISEKCGGKVVKGKLVTMVKGIKLYFTIIKSYKKAILVFQLNEPHADIFLTYHHQLQNFIFVLTGQKLLDDHIWILEY